LTIVNIYESPALRAVSGPVIRPGGFALTDRGLTRCCLAKGTPVLDIGCGTGAVVDYLRRRHCLAAVGLDRSALLLSEGVRIHPGSPLVRGQAERLPAAAGCFGAVLCECVLSLCADPQRVLQETLRVLRPGGHLVLTDLYRRGTNAGAQTREIGVRSCLQGAVNRSTTQSRVRGAGFNEMIWEDHTGLLKQLAAQLIWTYGSLDAFWGAVGGPDAARAMRRREDLDTCSRPGYYLLVARKPVPVQK
jgi:arsenite methyltransferase